MVSVSKIADHPRYVRHRPELGLVYRTVKTHWPQFLREQERVGKVLPYFIKEEFSDFLNCGIPEFGFIRTYCKECRESGIVAFSCKKRGFCPSCCARRMNDEAAHLVDEVLPSVATRQWVLSFPFWLRYQLAHNPRLTSQVLALFIQVISAFQKKRARKRGVKHSRSGSVTFIQRFGSALNLNVHLHSIFTDGVFYSSGTDTYKFLRLPAPTHKELETLVGKIHERVHKLSQKLGLEEQDQLAFDENSLGDLVSLSIGQKAGFGDRAGLGLRCYGIKKTEQDPERVDPCSVRIGGFSLNARVGLEGHERKKLEKLIRYMARGPVATERLSESYPDGLIYKLKTPWRDGTTYVSAS